MNETLEDLRIKRNAVMSDFNDLYDDLQQEVYKNTIKELKAKIRALESKLEMYKKQIDFMKKIKIVKVR